MKSFAVFVLILLASAECARAVDVALARVMPRGGTRGTELELTLTGNNLDAAQEILSYDPGLTVKEIKSQDARTAKAKIAIAPDARLGEYRLRLRTAHGLSHLRTFYVGALPVVEEKEPNNAFSEPQKIDLNVTVTGVVENEGVDHFVIEAKKGQRITAEAEGMRLGSGFLDPFVAIIDEDRFELIAADDSALLLQDPVASIVAPKDGRFVIQIRDSAYGGNNDLAYRLHVGTFPRPTAVFPAGGQTGQDLNVQFLGDVTGPFSQSIKLPAAPSEKFEILASQNDQLAPSANRIRVSAFPNVLESEPNDSFDKASLAPGDLPLAFNGIIEKPGDTDLFKFRAKKGQQFHVNVYARRLRSPLDAVVSIERGGQTVGSNDDNGGPDPYVRFNVPDDGEFAVAIRDHLRGGGPDFVYRVEITPVEPKLTVLLPTFDQNNGSQERQAIVVPKGNRFATPIRVQRNEFGQSVTLAPVDLPPGVTMHAPPVVEGVDTVPVVFEATPDASGGGRLANLIGTAERRDALPITGSFEQSVNLVPDGNNRPFYETDVERLAVAVAEEAPFSLELVQPKVPLVQGGSMQLKIVAKRKSGFDAPIRLQAIYTPPGVSAGGVEIEGGQSERTVPLNAEDGARVGKWKIAVLGSADAPQGRVWCSTQLAELDVAAPMLAMKMAMSTVERGQGGQVVVNIENKTPFDGKAKAKLVGLPPNCSASPDEVEFASSDKSVTFNVTTTDKAPVGQHNSLLCIATVTKDGEPIIHNLARGGLLRVDAPPSPEKQARAKSKDKPKDAKTENALSRLEKLRQEAAGK